MQRFYFSKFGKMSKRFLNVTANFDWKYFTQSFKQATRYFDRHTNYTTQMLDPRLKTKIEGSSRRSA